MLVWQKPDFQEQLQTVTESIDSVTLRESLLSLLESGRLIPCTAEFIRDNASNIPDSCRKYLEMEPAHQEFSRAASDHSELKLPAPVLLKLSGHYILFSGFELVSFAQRFSFPLEVWFVEKDENENQ